MKHFSFCEIGKSDDSHNNGLNLLVCNMLFAIASHPTWVCGLKQGKSADIRTGRTVTPYVGVWIETEIFRGKKG